MKKTPSAKAVKPNVGIRVWYRKRIDSLITQLKKSVMKWIPAAYRHGASAKQLEQAIEELREHWGTRFEKDGEMIAKQLVKRIDSTSKNALKRALAEVGFNVDWKNAPQVKNVLSSIKQSQVDLIKTIPQHQLDRVAGIVQRGIQAGRDLFAIQKELEAGFDITYKRARMIAVDQTNKATMAINRSRYLSVGIKEGIWQHVAGRYTSRKTHVSMHNKRFKLEGEDAGLYDSDVGRRVMPAECVNCKCTFRAVLPENFFE